MTNKLVTSVAAGALFAGIVAFAPFASAQDAAQPAPAAPMATDKAPAAAAPMGTQASSGDYITEQGADQIAASTYLGQSVYNSSDESIGEINDVIFSKDGSVEAAVIGVGGFLGIGEKNVAVPLDKVTVAEVPNSDDLKLTTTETADTLKSAPEFKTKAAQVAEQNSATPVDGSTTSSTTPMAPAGNNTMAPAGGAAPAGQPATTNP
ncbi:MULTISPECIES: PRC-barrel domain-containing protein [unclassified Rhizobium]|uniref:PRC-barrel domain-containing protein n=1 Tax=unclassified Rhizobium TaxID=2613769 RepID=UPI0009E8E16F|nr:MULTISPECIES: PRC-barrel domain-containing protein [unclassified Rhizobium]TCM55863.1 sporulation protein YlmC with PRC-barrel domain [Rhizobium sp. PP-F2F-G48]